MEIKRDERDRFVKGNMPYYNGKSMPYPVRKTSKINKFNLTFQAATSREK